MAAFVCASHILLESVLQVSGREIPSFCVTRGCTEQVRILALLTYQNRRERRAFLALSHHCLPLRILHLYRPFVESFFTLPDTY